MSDPVKYIGPWRTSESGEEIRIYEFHDGRLFCEFANDPRRLHPVPERPGQSARPRFEGPPRHSDGHSASSSARNTVSVATRLVAGESDYQSSDISRVNRYPTSASVRNGSPDANTLPQTANPRRSGSFNYELRNLSNAPRSDGPAGHRPSDASQHGRRVVPVASVRTSQEALVDERESTSSLTPLGQRFAAIKVGDYAQCENFLHENPTAVNMDHNQFVKEAIAALAVGKTLYARSCVQQSLILRSVNDLSMKAREKFWKQLIQQDRKSLREFLEDFDNVYSAVRKRSAASSQSTPQSGVQSSAIESNRHSGQANVRSKYPPTIPEEPGIRDNEAQRESARGARGARHATNPNPGTQTIASGIPTHQFDSMNIGDDGEEGAVGSLLFQNLPQDREDYPSGLVDTNPRSMDQDGGHQNRHHVSSPSTAPSKPDKQEPKTGLRESLDPRYTVKENPAKFFTVGRVFALGWTEGAGQVKHGSEPGSVQRYVTRYGLEVYTTIRRMVVVKERRMFSMCIPINTYGGLGLKKQGFRQVDIDAHGIIHMEGTNAEYLPREPHSKKRTAIVVRPSGRDQKLDVASRVRYDKIYTVEHHQKVMNVGIVTKETLPWLLEYWKSELDDEETGQTPKKPKERRHPPR